MYYLEQGELHISDQQTALKDRYNDNNQNFQEEFPIDAPELNTAATKIQAQFRGHKTRRNLEKKKHEKDETIDFDPQKADYANKQSKTFNDEYQESSLSTGANSQKQNNQASEDFNDDLTEEEKQQQERAATSIQAQFRGFKTRQNLQKTKQEKDGIIDSNQQNLDYANEQSKTYHDEDQKLSLSTDTYAQQQDDNADEEFSEELTEEERQEQERAAIAIQAQFRGFKTRQNFQKMKHERDGIDGSDQQNVDYENEQSSLSADAHAQQQERDNADEDNYDDLTEEEKQQQERAATSIQAQFRGFKTRQNLQKKKHEKDEVNYSDQQKSDNANEHEKSSFSTDAHSQQQENKVDEDNYDDLTEEEKQQQERAATSIQAQFRGFKTRQNLQKTKQEKDGTIDSDHQNVDYANEQSETYQDEDQKSSLSTDAHAQQQENKVDEDNYDELTEEEKQQQERAAVSIQAQFRGFKTRQNFQKMKQEKDGIVDSDQQNQDYANQQSKTHHDEDQQSSLPTGADTQQQERDNADEDNYDDLTEEEKQQQERAATSIQAQFRGFKTRQNFQKMKQEKDEVIHSDQQKVDYANEQSKTDNDEDQKSSSTTDAHSQQQENKVDEVNYDDLTEEEKQQQERAATSIQAQFRGFKTRQNIQKMKHEKDETIDSDQQNLDYANEQSKTYHDEDQKSSLSTDAHAQQQENKADEDNYDELTEEEKQEQERAAVSIQAQFRGFKTRQNFQKMKQEKDGIVDSDQQNQDYANQQSKTHHDEDQQSSLPTGADTQQQERDNADEDNYDDLTEEEKQQQERAATSIQAQFRGFKTRQNFQKMKQEKDEVIHSDQQKVDYANEQSKTDNDEDQKSSSTTGAHSQQQENKATDKFDNNYDRTATDVNGRHNLDEKLITPEKKNDDSDRLHSELEEETQFSKDFAKHTQLSPDSNYFQEQQNEIYNNEQDDMSDPNLDKAATRIQASYRGYKIRKELGTPGGNSITGQDQIHPPSNSPKIHDEYGNTRNKNILSPSAEGNKVLVGEDDDSAAAAVKIQAAYRGYRVRKDLEK
ncbi:unnamed protein product [Adineta steineri]|uniref:Uncharacterized protein n=1 Tax=Adineta steineri TaxID=433720 RepID=A0A818MGL5_9BILA|nr:unnamed protein product [Adineta steineri]